MNKGHDQKAVPFTQTNRKEYPQNEYKLIVPHELSRKSRVNHDIIPIEKLRVVRG